MYLVCRNLQDNGIKRIKGEIVSGKGYKLLSKLITLRYLKESTQSSFKCHICNREFCNEQTLESHCNEYNHKKGVGINESNNKGQGKGR